MPRSKTFFATVHKEMREEEARWITPFTLDYLRTEIRRANAMKRAGYRSRQGLPLYAKTP